MNLCVMIGRLVREPDHRVTPQGTPVTKFRIAVDNGKGKDALFIDVVTWRKLAEVCAEHLSKGRQVAISGKLEIRSYDGNDGTKRQAIEIVAHEVKFLGGRDQSGQGGAPNVGNEISFGDDLGDVPF